MSTAHETEVSLGQAIFGEASLGDQRRTARLVKSFDLLRRHPGGSLPEKLGSPPDLRAFYRLCDMEEMTHAAVIAAARAHTFAQIAAYSGTVLIIHDATELDYTSLQSLAGELGQIGKGNRRGYICQNVLAVAAETGEVLGLVDQILHHRVRVSKQETVAERRDRKSRESRLWLQGTRHLPADGRWIDVSDQGSETFEFLEHEARSSRRFVLRAHQIRKAYAGHTATGPQHYLKKYAASQPELGRFSMDVQPQKKRVARKDAEFAVRGGPVLVCPPHSKSGCHGDEPLPLYFVLLTELQPPAHEKAIEWMLLTNEPVHRFADAWQVSRWYEDRWIIEEFHKGQKTGCQIEDLQFTTTDRLEPAIAMLSVVAVTLLHLRDAGRRADAKERPATALLANDYVEVLSLWRHKKSRPDWSVHDFYYALARLGGHQNRKSDKPPGWIVLWRGWTKLQALLIGYETALRKRCGKT